VDWKDWVASSRVAGALRGPLRSDLPAHDHHQCHPGFTVFGPANKGAPLSDCRHHNHGFGMAAWRLLSVPRGDSVFSRRSGLWFSCRPRRCISGPSVR
jgi:hypothetical protein